MLMEVNPKFLIFCFTLLWGIVTPKFSFGITPNQSVNNLCQWDREESIYLAQSIICQRQLEPNILLRRIFYPDQGCFDEILDTNSGNILQRNPAPCDPNC